MSTLLEVTDLGSTVKQTSRGRVAPAMVEFEVNPELAPYLVSSTRSVMWVLHASQAQTVRAAVRKRQGLEAELVSAVVLMGERSEWGNVHSFTTDGVSACVEHLRYYGLEHLEMMVAPETDVSDVDFPDVPLHRVSWMPVGAVVAVPVDRGFVGTLGVIGQHKAVAVVHNASRGVAVAWR
jgi:hypothetical protein